MLDHFVMIMSIRLARSPSASLNSDDWDGSFSNTECTFHQLSPYIGKIKSYFAKKLITTYTKPKQTILDPFAGSGTIPLEAILARRNIIANDINPYAFTLINAKLFPFDSSDDAIAHLHDCIIESKTEFNDFDSTNIPDWVKKFYDIKTLREVLALTKIFKQKNDFFLTACLLGILHHERPGFLSYPSSHLIPYLRDKKYPPHLFPDLYSYRDVESRLIQKIYRAYRRVPKIEPNLNKILFQENAECLKLQENSIDAVISSPPYMNTLDYARDNRLRLWFLGYHDFKKFDAVSPKNLGEFQTLMTRVMENIYPALNKRGYCIFILGDINTTKKSINTANAILEIAEKMGNFQCEGLISDEVPMHRRARKEGSCTKIEWILSLKKMR